jgi:hypothetical protein
MEYDDDKFYSFTFWRVEGRFTSLTNNEVLVAIVKRMITADVETTACILLKHNKAKDHNFTILCIQCNMKCNFLYSGGRCNHGQQM